MAKIRNHKALKAIGAKIAEVRRKKNFEISDIADQTGLSYNTISKIENGQDTLFSSFLEVCFSLDVHPKKILEIELNVKPRFKLSPSRKEKSRLTARVKNLIERGHFSSWQGTSETVEKLQEYFSLNAESKNVSSILRRLSFENLLELKKEGRKNMYKIKK